MESLQSFVEPCETSGPTALAESCGTLKPSYNLTSNHPGPPRSPCRTSWDPARTVLEWPCKTWWNSGGMLMERYLKPARTAGGTLVKPWRNPCGTTPHPRRWNPGGTRPEHDRLVEPWWKPGQTLVEPYLKPPRTTLQFSQTWSNPGRVLVEPSWNLPQTRPPQPSKKLLEPWWNPRGTLPQTTPDHPAALVSPRGTLPQTTQTTPPLQKPGGNAGGTLVEPWWNPGGTLVVLWWNLWWNPGGTLAQGRREPPRSLSGLRPQSFQLLGKKQFGGIYPPSSEKSLRV